ncbi:aminotransferase class I/II-fold pyridoxal phosphate-dependent enzyme [Lacrimispora celerecrescens]|uniref:aminotransferase class I/II-fold pyridoxal phosphate-dependent enzyme n=1 Tax=Lacrimispora celerecrescens TaxID=29354 RepID=UPI001647B17D|nr:PLP-dependent transferase [Lacrimispora celerecrescens]
MNDTPNLLKKLMEYGESDFYPFHMPGHKRQYHGLFAADFPNPFSIDITEIHGFDNLHHPEGILKESMEWASRVYGSNRTYYLVNGSSSGILSAISGSVSRGGTILMSRNCHKSAFHGVFLNQLSVEYIYPQIIPEFGIQGGLIPEKIEEMLMSHGKIQAVFIVSPTYDGIVSDIKAIADVVHKFRLPLIVDEAHGAHFSFGRDGGFPVSALELGADVVIQSLHKTLPSFTQTAVMHVKEGYVDMGRLDRYVHMYQTSSPSYVLMAGIEGCIRYMAAEGHEQMKLFSGKIGELRNTLSGMKHLRLLTVQEKGLNGIYDMDLSKIIVSTRGTGKSGSWLDDRLRKEFHLEMEMCGSDYVTAITTLADAHEGLERLYKALVQIDSGLSEENGCEDENRLYQGLERVPESRMTIAQAMDEPRRRIAIPDGEDLISAEFVYVYPPGIPIVVPGEVLKKESIDLIMKYKELGLAVQGMEDEESRELFVVDEAGINVR